MPMETANGSARWGLPRQRARDAINAFSSLSTAALEPPLTEMEMSEMNENGIAQRERKTKGTANGALSTSFRPGERRSVPAGTEIADDALH